MTEQPRVSNGDLRELVPLFAKRSELMTSWWRICKAELGSWLEIQAADFESVFGREVERFSEADLNRSPFELDRVLEATASCLARRGVPLSMLLAVSACSSAAVKDVFGELSPSAVRALAALGAARAGAYARAYSTAEPERPRCAQSLMRLRGPRPAVNAATSYGIVGTSAGIGRVREAIQIAAEGPHNVLVTGESGSGKELVARAIHEAAGMERGRFVAVNAAALPSHWVERELFGHVRGAVPGAAGEYVGLFRAADGGTLFLDELSEMGPETQAKLLRVLEERAVRPVGGVGEVPVDVRVIASTNRDPAAAVAAGKLRPDLYHRLQNFTIGVPPLRERRQDIRLLSEHFLATFCHRRCGCIWGISERALAALTAADWPGNVRELKNAIEHAVTTGENGLIKLEDLPAYLRAGAPEADEGSGSPNGELPTLERAESDLIRATLEHFGGNKVRAAQSLGISRHKLYDRLRKLGLLAEGAETRN